MDACERTETSISTGQQHQLPLLQTCSLAQLYRLNSLLLLLLQCSTSTTQCMISANQYELHLYLQGIDLQQLGALLQVILPALCGA